MNQLVLGIKRFANDEQGVTMVEYGLIAALISIVCLVALGKIGTNLNVVYKAICNALNTALGTGGGGSACA